MFKKTISCVVCALLLVTCLMTVAVSAGPDDTMLFTLSVTEGGAGDTVKVSISIPENSRFTNAMMYLHYNPEAVSYVEESIEAGPASPKSGTMFEALAHTDKYFVKCAYITGGVVTKGGVLLTFDFNVLAAIPAAFSLSFDECQGEAEDGTMFEVKYTVVGCVLNNDGSLSNPTGEPVYTTAPVTPAQTTTATASPAQTTTTMSTMVVTDEGNNAVTIPVVTSTDADGNVATIPVVTVTDAHGATVTVPVVVVTDTQGSVATIPVAEGTDANGNDVTIPVAIVTDTEGNVQTVPVATATDAQGNIVTVPVTTSPTEPATDNGGLTTGIIIVVIGAVVAVIVAVAATRLRKKNEE